MNKKINNLVFRKMMALLLIAAMFCGITGCRKKASETGTTAAETTAAESTSVETEAGGSEAAGSMAEETAAGTEALDSTLGPEMQAVTDAIRAVVNSDGFTMDTTSDVSLQGSLISGDYEIRSTVEVNRKGENGLEMNTLSSSDMDEVVTKTWYENGTYYTDDGSTQTEKAMTEDEVMAGVSQVTDMVLDAAAEVENVSSEEQDSSMVYTYDIPTYLAEDYVESLVKTLEFEKLEGANVKLDTASMTTTVDAEGRVTQQTVTLSGKIHKAIISVPAEVKISADFGMEG